MPSEAISAEREEDAPRPGLIGQVRRIMLAPRRAWRAIAAEAPEGVLGGFVAPLALAGAAAIIGAGLMRAGLDFDAGLVWTAVAALIYLACLFGGVVFAGVAIALLSRWIGGQAPEPGRARQLAAYAAAPILLATIAALIPPVATWATMAGLVYALVLLGMGAPVLTPLPAEKTAHFMLSFLGVALAALFVFALTGGPLIGKARDGVNALFAAAPPERVGEPQRSATEQALLRAAETYGRASATDPARLEEQLPPSLPGGFHLVRASGVAGAGLAKAEGDYEGAGARMQVVVAQIAAGADYAPLAARLTVAEGRRADGFARTQAIDGRLYIEEARPERARFAIIGRGVALSAEVEGADVTIDQARAGLETINIRRLEAAFGR